MIKDLLRFIEIDNDTVQRGGEIWQLLEPRADTIVHAFYVRMRNFKIGSEMTDPVIGRLKIKQKQHWASLFGSKFDDEYANSVRRVGIQHRDINLDPMWYVAGYMTLKIAFAEALANTALPPIVNRRPILTPYRRPMLTPLSDEFWL